MEITAMTYDEAVTITAMVVTTWPTTKIWSTEEMTAYATGLMKYDAATLTRAVAAAQQKLMYRPSVAELREFYDLERAKTRASAERPEQPRARIEKVPLWVKGWCVSRYHYKDMRVWAEQDSYGLSGDLMPGDERTRYIEEGSSLTIDQVFSAIGVNT
jgi:hypothetical protein